MSTNDHYFTASPASPEQQRTMTVRLAGRNVTVRTAAGVFSPDGLDKGYYVKPTVLGKVRPDSTVAQEEIFGPVLSIITYKDEDEAVRIANGTPYGLAGGVWSKDEERAKKVARRIRAGQVDINGAPFNLLAPFGGFGQSGHGRELGRFGLEEFLEYKSLQLKPQG